MAWLDKHNLTILNEFILVGITDLPELQAPLFGLFLIVYMVSVGGNLGLIILTMIDSRLYTPLYFFLIRSDQIRSVAQSCRTLGDPMNRSTPGLPVHHQLPEFTQTHVH